jgi:hypothetical protein
MYTYLLLLGFEKFTVEFGFITLRPEEVAESSTSASFRASAHHIIRLFEELTAIFQFSIKSIETSRRPFNLRFDKPLTSRIWDSSEHVLELDVGMDVLFEGVLLDKLINGRFLLWNITCLLQDTNENAQSDDSTTFCI